MKKINFSNLKTNIMAKAGLLVCAGLMVFSSATYAQTAKERVYATSQTNNAGVLGTVTNAGDAVDGNPSSFSRLSIATVGSLRQDLIFPTTIPAGAKITVKIGLPSGVLSVLPDISIRARTSSGWDGAGVSLNNLANALGADSDVEMFLTASGNSNRVRVSYSAGLGLFSSMKVYEAYYEIDEASPATCEQFDAYDVIAGAELLTGNGILDLNGGVTNPLNMIDGDLSTFTEFDRGLISAGGYIYATAAFRSNYAAGDKIRFLMETNAPLLNLSVLSTISVVTYMDDVEAETFTLNESFIRLDLLNSGSQRWVEVEPTQAFNRVQIRLDNTVNASIFQTINIYDLQKVIATPEIDVNSQDVTIYSGQTATLTATASGTSDVVNWYDELGNTILYTGNTYTTGSLTANETYAVAASRFNCATNLSDTAQVNVIVLTVTTNTLSMGNVAVPYTDEIQLSGPGTTGKTYNYQATDPTELPDGLTLNIDGSFSGSPTQIGTFIFDVHITDVTDPSNILTVGTFPFTIEIDAPLPITLSYFNATAQAENSLLAWATASEQGNKEFAIERSIDGKEWSTIATISTKAEEGFSNESIEYSFVDEQVHAGVNLYRLKQIDFDGRSSFSHIEKVEFGTSDIQIYPNPSNGEINITGIEAGNHIQVVDVMGRMIIDEELKSNTHSLNLTNQVSGSYYIMIKDNNNQMNNFTVIKK